LTDSAATAFELEGREPLIVYLALTTLLVMRFTQGYEATTGLDLDARRLADRLERFIEDHTGIRGVQP
jgi:hypothetical protein